MNILIARKAWPEKFGFRINRPKGTDFFTCVHFLNEVDFCEKGQWRRIPAGSFIVFSPGTPQSWISADHPLRHDWFHATGDLPARMERFGLAPDILYTPINDPAISEAFGRLESNGFSNDRYREDWDNAALDELFIAVARGLQSGHGEVSLATADRLRRIRAELLAHPEKKGTVAELAEEAGLSEASFYRSYKKLFRVTPAHDHTAARLTTAAGLLSQGRSVADVAEAVGFSSEYTFIRAFRKEMDITPGQYKKKH